MQVTQLIETWSAIDSEAELTADFRTTLERYGYDQFNYAIFRGRGGTFDPTAIQGGWPYDWVHYYLGQGYLAIDPVVSRTLADLQPFSWISVENDPGLAPSQNEVMSNARAAGMFGAMTVPLHGPRGEVKCISLSSSDDGALHEPIDRNCVMLSYYFHSVYSSLEAATTGTLTGPILTARELEVLSWCAEGKSNWAIGEILGISEHSVKFHVRNVYRKLDANSRIAAVVKAIRMGLIQP